MALEDLLYPFINVYHKSPFWMKNIFGNFYRLLPNRVRYGKFYNEYFRRIKLFEKLSIEQQVLKQEKLLLDSVNFAINNIEFYKNYSEITSIDEFRSLPIVTKDLVNKDQSLFINQNQKNNLLKVNTGGSSGNPFIFYIQKGKTRSKESAHFDWFFAKFGYKKGKRLLMIRGKSLKGNSLYEYSALDNKLIINNNLINEETIEEIHSKILEFRPEFIHAYPSALLIFTKICSSFFKKNQFEQDIKSIFLGSERLSEEDFNYFKNFYKATIVNWFGHSECLVFGERKYEAEVFNFCPFYGFLELVDDNNNIIHKSNTIGRIVATGFDNEVMPLIRYDTGDLGELSETNQISTLNHLNLKNIQGRDKNFIYLSNNTMISLTSLIFGQHYKEFQLIRELQIEQFKKGYITISVVPLIKIEKEQINQLKQSILKTIKGNTLVIDIKTVDKTKKTPRGKHILLIQNIQ